MPQYVAHCFVVLFALWAGCRLAYVNVMEMCVDELAAHSACKTSKTNYIEVIDRARSKPVTFGIIHSSLPKHLQAYASHPSHNRAISNIIKPIELRSSAFCHCSCSSLSYPVSTRVLSIPRAPPIINEYHCTQSVPIETF